MLVKKEKRAQANIIVTILLVLIALTLIAVVSTFVIKIIKDNITNADISSRAPDISIEKAEVYDVSGTKMLQLSLQRGSDNENVTGVNMIVSDGTKVETRRENISLGSGEYRVISWQTTLSDIKSLEIYPIFVVSGREIIGTKADSATPTSNQNNGTLCLDLDKDGYNYSSQASCLGPIDCDDSNANIYTSSLDRDITNGIDENCDNIKDNYGLLAYYPLDGNANDLSGNNRNGIPTKINFVSGKINLAAQFAGVNDSNASSIYLGPDSSFFPLDRFSICLWENSSGIGNGMINSGIISLNYALILSLTNPEGFFRLRIFNASSTTFFSGTGNLYNSKFNYLCSSYNGTHINMYINGALNTSFSYPGWTMPTPIGAPRMGYDINNARTFFNGTMDEVRIYNRPLTQSEITYLYNLA